MSEENKVEEFKKPENILSKSNAKKEVEKIFDYYEIDIDDIEDKEQKKLIKGGYDRLIKAAMKGRLKVRFENGIEVIQTTRSGQEIVYCEISGDHKAEVDGISGDEYYRRSHTLMGALSGWGYGAIKQLKGPDLSLAEVLGFIFLAS